MSGAYAEAGALVRQARRAERLPQWELARRAGVSGSWLSSLERGHEPPTGRNWTAVTAALGLDPGARPAPPPPPAAPPEAVHPPVRWSRDITPACTCDWAVETGEGGRVAGWRVGKPDPGCPVPVRGAAA